MIQTPAEITRDLVFIGGGHAHAIALRMLGMRAISGLRITLISPASHTPYSGMLPGLVAGHYSFEETHIDLTRLCQWAGVRFLVAEVTAIDPQAQLLTLRGRPQIGYDLLSIDTGSEPELNTIPGAREWTVPVKPVAGLWRRWLNLSQKLQEQNSEEEHRVAVVGGGAGSVELILAMAQRLPRPTVTFELFCGASEILQGYNQRARKSVERALAQFDIKLHLGARVVSVARQGLTLADGSEYKFEDVFWCTGAAAAPWIAASGLQTDSQGFLAIRDTLQAVGYDNIFAAGDVATQIANPRPKAGVYAVRQGPVLSRNLRQFLLGGALKNHRPQQRFLSLISLGEKRATADRGPFSATGEWVWRWKDRIDREFMQRFEDYPEGMSEGKVDKLPELPGKLQQVPCGGCGAKIGADILAKVLTDLTREFPRHCQSTGQASDSAAIPGSGGTDIVQSIDVLREMVTDPWLMGRIAANHALSDLYASGARPLSALATVTLPFSSPSIQERELKQLLAGALHEFAKVDCQLRGGHSLQGHELNIGFVVNGSPISKTGGYLAKHGLNTGDHLVLTKPLGTGVLFAGHMQLRVDGRHIQAAVESMLHNNASAANLAVQLVASACTDVTGFGLLGHLLEMLNADQGAALQLGEVPLLAGAHQAICEGIVGTMHTANAIAGKAISKTASNGDQEGLEILFDPQTSGGLLIAISPDKSDELCRALQLAGDASSAIIGQVTSHDPSQSGRLQVQ